MPDLLRGPSGRNEARFQESSTGRQTLRPATSGGMPTAHEDRRSRRRRPRRPMCPSRHTASKVHATRMDWRSRGMRLSRMARRRDFREFRPFRPRIDDRQEQAGRRIPMHFGPPVPRSGPRCGPAQFPGFASRRTDHPSRWRNHVFSGSSREQIKGVARKPHRLFCRRTQSQWPPKFSSRSARTSF